MLSKHRRLQLVCARDSLISAVKELRRISSVCMRFKEVFVEFRVSVSVECANNPWIMPDALLFVRLDAFLDRTADIEELVQTIIQFTQLAKVQVGGTKGGMLTQAVQSIAADFGKAGLDEGNFRETLKDFLRKCVSSIFRRPPAVTFNIPHRFNNQNQGLPCSGPRFQGFRENNTYQKGTRKNQQNLIGNLVYAF